MFAFERANNSFTAKRRPSPIAPPRILKEGNHRTFKYTAEAWEIVKRQPKSAECIFPYDPKSVCAAFTRACNLLGIEGLRFHDLRHEATSRLFKRGYQIQEVAQFTLHDSWNELKRFTNRRPADVRDIATKGKDSRRPNGRGTTASRLSHVADQSAQPGLPH